MTDYPSRGRARFGVLVPFTNSNLEPDFTLLRPEGVSLHFARLSGYDRDEIPDEAQMQGLGAADMGEVLEMIAGVRPDVVFYGCTSATLTHGVAFDRDLAAQIKAGSGARTVTAAGALVAACRAVGASKIGFASPYVPAINDLAVEFLASEGITCVARSEVAETLDNDGQGALTPERVFDLGLGADLEEADAVVLSCTDMRSVETLGALEVRLGKPVITSNQAMMWQGLQTAGMADAYEGYGALLERRFG